MMEQQSLIEIPEIQVFPDIEEIEIYHDEIQDNKEKPLGHQFLVVPIRSKELFHNLLAEERARFNAKDITVNWKKLREKSVSRVNITKRWLELLSETMYNRPFKYREGYTFLKTSNPLGIRVASIFIKSKKEMSDKYWFHIKDDREKTKKKFETLMRMGIKGCLHYCFNPEYTKYKKVRLIRFNTDGKVFGNKPLDSNRVLQRIGAECRDYVEIPSTLIVNSVLKSKTKTPEVDFQELVDTVLGATCYICQDKKIEWKENIVEPLKDIYDKRKRGRFFEKSPHHRTFTLSWCEINKNSDINITPWKTKEYKNLDQLNLNI